MLAGGGSGNARAIAARLSIPTGYERALPPSMQLTVRARRRFVFERARGSVLDLGGATSHDVLWSRLTSAIDDVEIVDGADDPALRRLVRAGERFDTVVSVFQLATADDVAATLSRLRRLLHDDGTLEFLEPSVSPGIAARGARLFGPATQRFVGWRPDLDIPATLRRGDLSVIDLDRHRAPTMQPWLRGLVEGTARHQQPAARSDDGTG